MFLYYCSITSHHICNFVNFYSCYFKSHRRDFDSL